MTGNWQNSTRRARLPKNWEAARRRILQRDNHHCQLRLEGCTGRATEVDHRVAGDNHDPTNLQAVCSSCHKRKTQAEAALARAPRPSRRRAQPNHPGLL